MADTKPAAATPIPAHLPTDLVAVWQTYVEMFGAMPPLPAAKFDASGRINPQFLRAVETLRTQAFYNAPLGMKTSQLILFAMLLIQGNGAAAHHAHAARRAGATMEELHAVVELATAVGALAPSNNGGNILNAMMQAETRGG